MAKLVNFIPGRQLASKPIVKEALDDLDTNLPVSIERYLDKMVKQIKGMSLSRKKEILVLAKVIEAMGIDKQELMRYVSKIKKNDILKK